VRATRTSTLIAKLLPALAFHCAAAIVPLYPILTFGTLLELGSSYEVNELLIIRIEAVTDTILGARHAGVVLASAFKTVMFLAGRAPVIIQDLIELENSSAACSRAPGNIDRIAFHISVESILFIFLA
jgi:hypothetical protein